MVVFVFKQGLAQTYLPPVYEIKSDTALMQVLDDSLSQKLEDKEGKWTIGEVSKLPLVEKFHTPGFKAEGIDISTKKTRKVFDLLNEGRRYDYVITVCDEANAERCPIFPGTAAKLHWPFSDPSRFTGSHDEKLAKTKQVLEEIRTKIIAWLKE